MKGISNQNSSNFTSQISIKKCIDWIASQVDKEGNLLIDGLLDPVAEVTRDELATYAGIDFDVEQYRVVQLNFTPEIEVLYMLFEEPIQLFSMTSLKQQM